MPFVYKGAGLTPRYEGGRIVGFDEGRPQPALRGDIETKLLQRSQAALAGTLPLDPSLERGLSEQQQLLQGTLAQQLGPGYATSTPGMQALATQGQRAEELRYGARTGQLTLAEQLGLQREQASEARQSRQFAQLGGALGAPGTTGAGTSNYLQGLAQALGLGLQGRGQQAQMAQFQAQSTGLPRLPGPAVTHGHWRGLSGRGRGVWEENLLTR